MTLTYLPRGPRRREQVQALPSIGPPRLRCGEERGALSRVCERVGLPREVGRLRQRDLHLLHQTSETFERTSHVGEAKP
jgi:hypothetical protein